MISEDQYNEMIKMSKIRHKDSFDITKGEVQLILNEVDNVKSKKKEEVDMSRINDIHYLRRYILRNVIFYEI